MALLQVKPLEHAKTKLDTFDVVGATFGWGRDELVIHQVCGTLRLGAVIDGRLAGSLPWDPAQSLGPHQPFHGAAGNPNASAVEFGVHLLAP